MRRLLSITLLTLLALFTMSSFVFAAGVGGTPHDFRSPENGGPNTKYPVLAQKAGENPCIVCHTSHSAFFNQALFAEDYGWEPGRKIRLPSSGLCMGCHDGDLKTDSGEVIIDNPDLKIQERHPRHRVEFPYPSREGHLPTYARVVQDDQGRYWALGANDYRLPLEYNEESGQTMAGCTTCHNAHDPGTSGDFLRTTYTKELCWTCHSQEAKRVTE